MTTDAFTNYILKQNADHLVTLLIKGNSGNLHCKKLSKKFKIGRLNSALFLVK